MIGLCIKCKSDGINTSFETDVMDITGRVKVRRYCGNHSPKKTILAEVKIP